MKRVEKKARTKTERKPTLKTIADHLGFTPGTVSAALNNSAAARSVPEHTKQRIRAIKVHPGDVAPDGTRRSSSITVSSTREALYDTELPTSTLTPSMRRPVDVKAHFRFLVSVSLFLFSQAAPVAIVPSRRRKQSTPMQIPLRLSAALATTRLQIL